MKITQGSEHYKKFVTVFGIGNGLAILRETFVGKKSREFGVDCLCMLNKEVVEEKDRYSARKCSSLRHLQDLLAMPTSEISLGNVAL